MLLFFCLKGLAQQEDTLFHQIKRLDSLTFGAFNLRDIKTFEKYFDKSLEFFHDEGGLTGYAHTVNFLKETANAGNDFKKRIGRRQPAGISNSRIWRYGNRIAPLLPYRKQ